MWPISDEAARCCLAFLKARETRRIIHTGEKEGVAELFVWPVPASPLYCISRWHEVVGLFWCRGILANDVSLHMHKALRAQGTERRASVRSHIDWGGW